MASPGAEGPWTIKVCEDCRVPNHQTYCDSCGSPVSGRKVEVVDRRVADDYRAELVKARRDFRDIYNGPVQRPIARAGADRIGAVLSRYTEEQT